MGHPKQVSQTKFHLLLGCFWLKSSKSRQLKYIFPSRVSGRGLQIGTICVCVCVTHSVCLSVKLALSRPNQFTYRLKIGYGDILDGFYSQGHRLDFKVARLKDVIFLVSDGSTCADSLCHVI